MSWPTNHRLTIGQAASLACVLEASAHKPGNVHRAADFENMTYVDMIAAAIAIGPVLDGAQAGGVGAACLGAVQATRESVAKNTNLGTVLLLGPLSVAASHGDLRQHLPVCLRQLTPRDARDIYAAIRLAQPGGLGHSPVADVRDEPPLDVQAAMQQTADRDMVAKQYVCDFEDVFEFVLPSLENDLRRNGPLLDAIVHTHVETMAKFPDSLIARKCGQRIALESSVRAQRVIDAGSYGDDAYHAELAELDFWLRADGHRRNPGTTADLMAAALFVGLFEQRFGNSMP